MTTVNFTPNSYDVLRDCSRLASDMTFKNLYSLICNHGTTEAAVWLEDGCPRSMTFKQLAALTDNYASYFSSIFGTGGRVCISADSCKEWFPLFWGLVRSGHDVLAVDAAMSDEKVAALMRQAGCHMIVSSKIRNVGKDCAQVLLADMAKVPDVVGYVPVWGHDVALCTSGTTSESRVFVYDEKAICYHALFSEKVYRDNKNILDNKPFRTMAFRPFHHVLGFSAIFIWSHFTGYTTIYLKDRTPQTIARTAKACRVTQIVTVPILANNLCRTLLANVRKQGLLKRVMFSAMTSISLGVQRLMPDFGLRLAAGMFRNIREQMLGNDIMAAAIRPRRRFGSLMPSVIIQYAALE